MPQSEQQPTKRCIDCPSGARPRPAPYPGPRCFSHNYEVKRQRRARDHDNRMVRTYRGIGPGDYDRIWEHQGQRDPICGRTLHTTKRGALEHDHHTNWPSGITCQPCNDYIGYIRRDPAVARRLVNYLTKPPAWDVIGPPPEQGEPPL